MNSQKRLSKLMDEIPDEGPTREQYIKLHELLTDMAKPKSLWGMLREDLSIWHLVLFLVGVGGVQLILWLTL